MLDFYYSLTNLTFIRFNPIKSSVTRTCPSQWQLRFLSTLYDQSERYRRLSLIHQPEQTTNDTHNTAHQDDHKLIMEAAFKRDDKTACELLKAHIEHSNQRIIETVF